MAQRSPERITVAALVWLLFVGLAYGAAPRTSLLPPPRPASILTVPQKPVFSMFGSVCGVASIKGAKLSRIGDSAGCGIAAPVRVTSVSGVRLTPAAVIDCASALAINDWVAGAAQPAFAAAGSSLAGLEIAGSYVCRTRNNQPGAKLSEHAQGKAVDVSGFLLRSGRIITVAKGWGSDRHGPVLKQLHTSACDSFGTVLGPQSDEFHHDHFHLDTELRDGGAYCR